MKTIAFFNNKGGVGKTTLVYHLAWMLSDLGQRVVVADLDPQANLTGLFLDEERLEEIWGYADRATSFGALRPVFDREGPQQAPRPELIGDRIALLVGDLSLSLLEDKLGQSWNGMLTGDPGDFRLICGFSRLIQEAGSAHGADIALVDVGPNLGALNRAALLACDHVVVPVGADFFSLQGLRNMGPTVRRWRSEWAQRLPLAPPNFQPRPPSGNMAPLGYVVMRHSVRLDRPVKAYSNWIGRLPQEYARSVLNRPDFAQGDGPDPECLANLRDYRSLVAMSHERRKPIFHLRSADGAFGGHQTAVSRAEQEFRSLTETMLQRAATSELL